MSQLQSHTTDSPASSQHVDETETNVAQNTTINSTQSKTSHTPDSDGRYHAVGEDDEITPEQANKERLPEQKHAGAIGYGPNFANKNRATLGDKITGIKEQVVGKVINEPELVQKGHDRKTGELKKREQEEEHETDPFATDVNQEPASSPGTTTSTRTDNAR